MTTTHRIGIGIVLALALALAVSASARPFDLNANGSEVPAGAASTQTTSNDTANAPSSFVHAASARVAHQLAAKDGSPSTPAARGPRSEVVSGGGYGSGTAVYKPPAHVHYSAADMTAYALGRVAAARQIPAPNARDSFSYRDAALGAGVAAAAASLIAVSLIAMRRHRRLHYS